MAIATTAHGKNSPPDDTEILRERLADVAAPLVARRDELLKSFESAPLKVADEENSGKVADLIRAIMACRKASEGMRIAEKEPHLAAQRAVDAFFKKSLTDRLDDIKAKLEVRLTEYQREKAEQERRAREIEAKRQREEAERAAKEAADKAAALANEADLDAAIEAEVEAEQAKADAVVAAKAAEASAADLSRSRGDMGAVASLRTFWDFEALDRATLDLEALRQHLPHSGLETAVRAFIKAGGRTLKGVRIFENTQTVVR